jgi:hypothetical protein
MTFFKKFGLFICLGSTFAFGSLQTSASPFETGDFLFVDLDCGAICDAIEDVTLQQFGSDNPRLSHVGLIENQGAQSLVWEAWPAGGVIATPLGEFLNRKGARHFWAPLEPRFRDEVKKAIEFFKSKKGLPYNSAFLEDKNSYYCAQLIQEALPQFFKLVPMYFGQPQDKNFTTWAHYYAKLGMTVPQGLPGVSPLGLYQMGKAAQLFKNASLISLEASR